jgi:membrane associated rhomboid family serine protease
MIPLKDDIPTSRTAVVTVGLIAANVLVFLWQMAVGMHWSVWAYGAVPYEVWTGRDVPPQSAVGPPFTVLTSMFLHGGWAHLAFNMLFLWVFGNNVEDALGRGRFLLFYLLCGIAAAAGQIVLSGPQLVPMVGASGAIAGVLGAYLILFPRARVLTVVPIFVVLQFIWLPASVFLLVWFAVQLLSSSVGGQTGGGVAWFAHVGGFLAGMALVVVFAPGRIDFRLRRFRQRRYRWS